MGTIPLKHYTFFYTMLNYVLQNNQRYYYNISNLLLFSSLRKTRYVKGWLFFIYWASAVARFNKFLGLYKIFNYLYYKSFSIKIISFFLINIPMYTKYFFLSKLSTTPIRCVALIYFIFVLIFQIIITKQILLVNYKPIYFLKRNTVLNSYLLRVHKFCVNYFYNIKKVGTFYRFLFYYLYLKSTPSKLNIKNVLLLLKKIFNSYISFSVVSNKNILNLSFFKLFKHGFITALNTISDQLFLNISLFIKKLLVVFETKYFHLQTYNISFFIEVLPFLFKKLLGNRFGNISYYYKQYLVTTKYWIALYFEELIRYSTFKSSDKLIKDLYKYVTYSSTYSPESYDFKFMFRSYVGFKGMRFLMPKQVTPRTGLKYSSKYLNRESYINKLQIEFLCIAAYGFTTKAGKLLFNRFESIVKMTTFLDFFLLLDRTLRCFFSFWYCLSLFEINELFKYGNIKIMNNIYSSTYSTLAGTIIDNLVFIHYDEFLLEVPAGTSYLYDPISRNCNFLYKKWYYFFLLLDNSFSITNYHFLNLFYIDKLTYTFFKILLKFICITENIYPIRGTPLFSKPTFHFKAFIISIYKPLSFLIKKLQLLNKIYYTIVHDCLEVRTFKYLVINYFINACIEFSIIYGVRYTKSISKIYILFLYTSLFLKSFHCLPRQLLVGYWLKSALYVCTFNYFKNRNILLLFKPSFYSSFFNLSLLSNYLVVHNNTKDILNDFCTDSLHCWSYYSKFFIVKELITLLNFITSDYTEYGNDMYYMYTYTKNTIYYTFEIVTFESFLFFENLYVSSHLTTRSVLVEENPFDDITELHFHIRKKKLLLPLYDHLLINQKRYLLANFFSTFHSYFNNTTFFYRYDAIIFIYKFPKSPYYLRKAQWGEYVSLKTIFSTQLRGFFNS